MCDDDISDYSALCAVCMSTINKTSLPALEESLSPGVSVFALNQIMKVFKPHVDAGPESEAQGRCTVCLHDNPVLTTLITLLVLLTLIL